MANLYYVRGMVPKESDRVDDIQAFPKSTSSAAAMFVGGPYFIVGGEARTSVAGHTNVATNGITGTIVALLDSTGAPVQNLAANAAGTVIGTTDPDRVYVMTMDETHYAGAADFGKYYDITAEGATVASGDDPGSSFSSRQIDSSTETSVSTDGVIIALGRVPALNNDAATAGTQVYCKINPAFYTTAG